MTADRFPRSSPRIGAIGLASWDRSIVVEAYPDAGSWTEVFREEVGPGGTTSNTAAALAKLGARVSFRSVVGDDPVGISLTEALTRTGVDTRWMSVRTGESTDAATMIVSSAPPDRTIFWRKGARIARGDQIDISGLFGHDLVFVDVDDPWLFRFLVDLPVHTLPNARLLASLSYLDNGFPDALSIAIRADAIVGNQRELMALTGTATLNDAIAATRDGMRFENLRGAAISLGSDGAIAFTQHEQWHVPAFDVDLVDTTGAGDAFAAGIAFGMACRWQWPDSVRFANAIAAHVVSALGAQAGQPSWDDVMHLLAREST